MSLLRKFESEVQFIKREFILDPLKYEIDSCLATLEKSWRSGMEKKNLITWDSVLTVNSPANYTLRAGTINFEEISPIMKDLFIRIADFVLSNDGVQAISLPQLGVPYKGFVCKLSDGARVFLNPRIFKTLGMLVSGPESCLSVPGKEIYVERYEVVTVIYYDINYRMRMKRLRGYNARLVQHMIDHLEGKLIE